MAEVRKRKRKTRLKGFYKRHVTMTIAVKQNWLCALCNKEMLPPAMLAKENRPLAATLDHIIPLSMGGTDRRSNLRAAHERCNRVRGSAMTEDEKQLYLADIRSRLGLPPLLVDEEPKEVEVARCSGHCCTAFTLPYDSHTFALLRDAVLARCKGGIDIIAPMLIPLGHFPGGSPVPGPNSDGETVHPSGGWYYTCMHYDKQSGNCGIYDRRPSMCSKYPYGNECRYPGCTRRVERSSIDYSTKLEPQ